jgi:ABC-type uncharacterized transport system involved in gliding motility auxiliary subunit
MSTASASTGAAARTRQRLVRGVSGLTLVLLVAGSLLFLNLLVQPLNLRLDLTRDQRFTVSPATRTLLRTLPYPVRVYAFVSSELPPPYNTIGREIADLMTEYRSAGGGRFEFILVDPGHNEEDQQRAANFGIRPVTIGEQSRDAMSFREVWMGLALVAEHPEGDRQEVLPQIFPGMNYEYEITRRMRDVLREGGLPVLGIAIGDGSFIDRILLESTRGGPMGQPGADRDEVVRELSEALGQRVFEGMYDVRLVDLREPVPDDVQGLIVLGPTGDLDQAWLQNLDRWVQQGGGTAVFASAWRKRPLGQDFGNFGVPEHNDEGLLRLLRTWGVELRTDRLVDREASQVSIAMQTIGYMGEQPIRQPLPTMDPRLPLVTRIHTGSVLVPNIALLAFQPADRVSPLPLTGLRLTPDAEAAVQAGTLQVTEVAATADSTVSVGERDSLSLEAAWDPLPGEEAGSVPVMMTLEGRIPAGWEEHAGTAPGRVLVVSSGDFITNLFQGDDPLQDPRLLRAMPPQVASTTQQYAMNSVLFLKNAADWLASDADLVAIRTRGLPAFVQTDRLTRTRKNLYQLVNIVLIPVCFVLLGIVSALVRRRRRLALTARFAGA